MDYIVYYYTTEFNFKDSGYVDHFDKKLHIVEVKSLIQAYKTSQTILSYAAEMGDGKSDAEFICMTDKKGNVITQNINELCAYELYKEEN